MTRRRNVYLLRALLCLIGACASIVIPPHRVPPLWAVLAAAVSAFVLCFFVE